MAASARDMDPIDGSGHAQKAKCGMRKARVIGGLWEVEVGGLNAGRV